MGGSLPGAHPAYPGPGDVSLPTEIRSAAPKLRWERERRHDGGGRKEAARTLLSISFPKSLLLPWLRSALCYNQAQVPGEGPQWRGGTPRGCPLTMPPWLAVPEVPTVEEAAPMAPLPVSLP